MLPNLLGASPFDDGELLAQLVAGTIAVALVVWHGGGLLLGAAVRRWPERRGLQRLLRWSPARARRLAGLACGASIVLTPVAAFAAPSTPTTATPAADEPFVRAPATAAPVPVPPPAPAPASSLPAPPTAPPAPPAARTHVVVAGDNLWRIAADEVARTTGVADPSDRAVVPYWRAVMDANRATLRSGDPSLIFPGEIVTLPAS